MRKNSISIIVPVFNEVRNIEPLFEKIESALSGYDWELIFVDDASTDGTTNSAYELSLKHEQVRLVLRFWDRGLAKSTIQGMLSAKGQVLCVMDGDGQHDPAFIPELLALLENGRYDIVSAARRLGGNAILSDALSQTREKLSQVGNALSSLIIGRRLADPLTGFFMLRRDAFLEVAPRLTDPGFKLLLDILHSKKDLRHAEHPFDFGTRMSGESKLDSFVIWQFATYLLSKFTGGILPASLISFLIVGASGLVVHFAVLYAALAWAANFSMAQLLATFVAATSNFMLNNMLTFRNKRLRGWKQLWGYAEFMIVSSVGIVANVSAATITYERLGQIVILATLAGIAIDTIWKYAVAKRLIWR